MQTDHPRIVAIQNKADEMAAKRDVDYERYKENDLIWGLVPKCRITQIEFPRISKEIIDRYLALDDMTSDVSDILDSMGICGAVSATRLPPLAPGMKAAGTACTIRNLPERKAVYEGYVNAGYPLMSTRDSYHIGQPGDILCVDFGGNVDVSCMGGMSINVAQTWGFAANIVNGCVRDVDTILKTGYPVWSVGKTQQTGKFRLEAVELNGPINMCGIRIEAGDLVLADGSGICVVPPELVEVVLEKAEGFQKHEEKLYALIKSHCTLSELRPLVRARYDVKKQ